MTPEIDEKIHAYLDEEISPEEMDVLSGWIKSDPENARYFAQATMLHDRLANEIGVQRSVASEEEKIARLPLTAWLAAAAAVVLGLGLWLFWPAGSNTNTFVTIARAEGWMDLRAGERLGAGSIKLPPGIVRLLFDSGVEVTLEGPASFDLVDRQQMILNTGVLAASVPPGAEGFRVDTPSAEIVDLGTAFGVHLDPSGGTHVSVFDGEVEVAKPGSATKKRLAEGEEAVISIGNALETVNIDLAPYEKVWPVSSGIEGSTGSFQLAPPWPRRLAILTSDEHIFVVPDGYRKVLDAPLRVNISASGRVTTPDELSPTDLAAGSPLRSFLLHFRPTEAAPRRFSKRLSGTITFDRPIVGLVVQHEEFKASAGIFSTRKAGEGRPGRALELTGAPNGDRITLSDDMRTLTVDLSASLKSFDLIRVIVDASATDLAKN